MATATNTRRAGVRRSEQRQEAADAAELALLGVIIRDNAKVPDILAALGRNGDECFRSHANRVLYRVIQQLDAEGIPVDLVSLATKSMSVSDRRRWISPPRRVEGRCSIVGQLADVCQNRPRCCQGAVARLVRL